MDKQTIQLKEKTMKHNIIKVAILLGLSIVGTTCISGCGNVAKRQIMTCDDVAGAGFLNQKITTNDELMLCRTMELDIGRNYHIGMANRESCPANMDSIVLALGDGVIDLSWQVYRLGYEAGTVPPLDSLPTNLLLTTIRRFGGPYRSRRLSEMAPHLSTENRQMILHRAFEGRLTDGDIKFLKSLPGFENEGPCWGIVPEDVPLWPWPAWTKKY